LHGIHGFESLPPGRSSSSVRRWPSHWETPTPSLSFIRSCTPLTAAFFRFVLHLALEGVLLQPQYNVSYGHLRKANDHDRPNGALRLRPLLESLRPRGLLSSRSARSPPNWTLPSNSPRWMLPCVPRIMKFESCNLFSPLGLAAPPILLLDPYSVKSSLDPFRASFAMLILLVPSFGLIFVYWPLPSPLRRCLRHILYSFF